MQKTEIYRGAPNLIHVQDGQRAALGREVAHHIDVMIRSQAVGREPHQLVSQNLCPGCYMVVGFNAMVELAQQNGQSLTELANSMIGAFQQLRDQGIEAREDIEVQLDPC